MHCHVSRPAPPLSPPSRVRVRLRLRLRLHLLARRAGSNEAGRQHVRASTFSHLRSASTSIARAPAFGSAPRDARRSRRTSISRIIENRRAVEAEEKKRRWYPAAPSASLPAASRVRTCGCRHPPATNQRSMIIRLPVDSQSRQRIMLIILLLNPQEQLVIALCSVSDGGSCVTAIIHPMSLCPDTVLSSCSLF